MTLDGHELTDAQNSMIDDLLSAFASKDKDVKLDIRDRICGIGKEGQHLYCYFYYNAYEDNFGLKFKTGKKYDYLTEPQDFSADMEETLKLFETGDYRRKSKGDRESQRRVYDLNAISDKYPSLVKDGRICLDEGALKEGDYAIKDRCFSRFNELGYEKISDFNGKSIDELFSLPRIGIRQVERLLDMLQDPESYRQERELSALISSANPENRPFNTSISGADIKDLSYDKDEYEKKYAGLFAKLKANIKEFAKNRLDYNAKYILFHSIGLDCGLKFYGEMAQELGINRTECEQIYYRACKAARVAPEVEEFKTSLSDVPIGEFVKYILHSTTGERFAVFFYDIYLNKKIFANALHAVRTAIWPNYANENKRTRDEKRVKELASKFRRYIKYDTLRTITDKQFGYLKKERRVKTYGLEEFMVIDENGERDYCESGSQVNVYYQLRASGIFKEIKTQSLKINCGDAYIIPTFQCLTQKGYFVVVDVKPLIRMSRYEEIKRFNRIKEYCEEKGFGYMVIDEDGNSFFDIDETLEDFDKEVISYIVRHGVMDYGTYKSIRDRYDASQKNLITMVKKYDLALTHPFALRFANK